MFTKKNTSEFRTLMEGVVMRPLAFVQKTILCEFKLEKGIVYHLIVIPMSKQAIFLPGS